MTAGKALAAALLACAFIVAGAAEAVAEPPRRIASINLCADQYLLALVPRSHILALSPNADNPALSAAYDEAQGIPKVKDDVESVLALEPDVVVASVYSKPSTLKLLERLGIKVVVVPDATNFEELRSQMRTVAEALDVEAGGAALLEKLDRSLARLKGLGEGKSALYLDRGGFAQGAGTLIGALFRHAGLTNAAHKLGGGEFAPAPLELAILAEPDIVVTPARPAAHDQASLMLRHPALAKRDGIDTLRLPVRETVCPGPSWIAAIERFADRLSGRAAQTEEPG